MVAAMSVSLFACGNEEKKEQKTSVSVSTEEITTDETESETSRIESEESSEETTEVVEESATSEIVSEEETTENKVQESTTKKQETTKKQNGSSSKEETTTKKPSSQSVDSSTDLSKSIKNILAKIITSDMNELDKVLAIHDYITYNVDYDYDNYLKNTIPSESYTAEGALKTGRAVCSGYALLFYEMAKAAGLNAEYITGTADNGSGNGKQGHAWNQVKVDGTWYNLDVCWDDATWEGKKSDDHSSNSYFYCLVSDSVLYKDHFSDSNNVNKCPNGYDRAAIAKSLAKVCIYKDVVFAESEDKYFEVINSMVAKGKTTFSVYVIDKGQDYWQQISNALARTKKPLWIESASGKDNFVECKVTIKENVRIAENVSDVKKAIDEYKDKIDQLELWYYDSSMNENNSWSIVNDVLASTGYSVEINAMTSVQDGRVECKLLSVDNVLMANNLSDIVEYYKVNGLEKLQQTPIWIELDGMTDSQIDNAIKVAFIVEGYLVDTNFISSNGDVKKFYVWSPREAIYFADSAKLKEYVNKNGLESLVGPEFYIVNTSGQDYIKFVNNFLFEAQYPVSYVIGNYGDVLSVTVSYVHMNAYISTSKEDLKDDILAAKNGLVLDMSEFRFNVKGSTYSEDDIRNIINDLNCGVVIDSYSYNSDLNYHSIIVRSID